MNICQLLKLLILKINNYHHHVENLLMTLGLQGEQNVIFLPKLQKMVKREQLNNVKHTLERALL